MKKEITICHNAKQNTNALEQLQRQLHLCLAGWKNWKGERELFTEPKPQSQLRSISFPSNIHPGHWLFPDSNNYKVLSVKWGFIGMATKKTQQDINASTKLQN